MCEQRLLPPPLTAGLFTLESGTLSFEKQMRVAAWLEQKTKTGKISISVFFELVFVCRKHVTIYRSLDSGPDYSHSCSEIRLEQQAVGNQIFRIHFHEGSGIGISHFA